MANLGLEEEGIGHALADIERRASPRVDLIVRIHYATVDEVFSDFTRDINEGGLFVETDNPLPVGSEVALQFRLPGGWGGVESKARVVRVAVAEAERVGGMAVEFDDLSDVDRDRLNRIISDLRSSRRHG
jgi:uncharacterized protein (TIGR02266 family)